MNEKVSKTLEWIEHKGIRIAVADYRGLSGEALAGEIERNTHRLVDLAERQGLRDLLLLQNIEGALFTGGSVERALETGKILAPYLKAVAGVGVSEIQKFVGWLFVEHVCANGAKAKRFRTVGEAKDWLATQARS